MVKKAKGKKGNKKTKEKRSRKKKRGKNVKIKGKKLSAEEASALMLYLLVQSRLQALDYYKRLLNDLKTHAEYRRKKLHQTENERHQYLKELLANEDSLKTAITGITEEQQHLFSKTFDLGEVEVLQLQRVELENLYDSIHKIEDELEKFRLESEEIIRIKDPAFAKQLEEEREHVKKQAIEAQAKRNHQLELIAGKHEKSINITNKRVEKVISDLEIVASQREISSDFLKIYERNRTLRSRVNFFRQELQTLQKLVDDLEENNLNLICESIQVDWNLLYGESVDIEQSEDSETDDGSSELSNENFSDSESATSLPSITTGGLKNSAAPHKFETENKNFRKHLPKLPSSTKSLSTAKDIECAAKEIIEKEINLNKLSIIKHGVVGEPILLRRIDIHHAGPIKYYGNLKKSKKSRDSKGSLDVQFHGTYLDLNSTLPK